MAVVCDSCGQQVNRVTPVVVFGGVPADPSAMGPEVVRHSIHGYSLPPRPLFETGYDHEMGHMSVQRPLVVRVSFWQLLQRSFINLCRECAKKPDDALASLTDDLEKGLRDRERSQVMTHWWLQKDLPYEPMLRGSPLLPTEAAALGLPDTRGSRPQPLSVVRIADLVRYDLAARDAAATLAVEGVGSWQAVTMNPQILALDGVVEAVVSFKTDSTLKLAVAAGRHELGIGLRSPQLSFEARAGTTSRIQLTLSRWLRRPQATLLETTAGF